MRLVASAMLLGGCLYPDKQLVHDQPMDASRDSAGDAGKHFVYTATVADCVDPTAPNPDTCKQQRGADQLVVVSGLDGFVRFDLDGAFGGGALASVVLEVTASSNANAASSDSGVVWQVAAFARADLFSGEPAHVGTMPIAPSQGSVHQLDVVRWPLPTSLATPSGSVYLELTSSLSDGVYYWNLAGANPPRLVIDLQ